MNNYQTPGYGQNNVNRSVNPQQQTPPAAFQWPHMSLSNWVVTFLLMLIPIANIVLMFVWAFGGNVNPSKKTYFQAALIMMAIGVVLMILLGGVITSIILSMAGAFS